MRNEKMCPSCKTTYSTYPVVSRKDNVTEICSKCGEKEARDGIQRPRKNTISTCLSDDWEVLDTDVRLHIPTMWAISSDARELNGGGRRIILLDLNNYCYVLIGNIGDDFAIDMYQANEAYVKMMGIFNSFDKGNVVEV